MCHYTNNKAMNIIMNAHRTFNKLTQEDIDRIKKRNRRIIDKVSLWQDFKYVKPLACKKDDCDGILTPKESRLKVILRCPLCGFVQSYVPKTILKTKLSKPEVMLKHQGKS